MTYPLKKMTRVSWRRTHWDTELQRPWVTLIDKYVCMSSISLPVDNEKWQKKVWFSVRPLLNLNRTALNLNRWSGSKFGTLLEPNLKSGSRFGKILREPDRTELRHP